MADEEISTDVSMLEESIDATGEVLLELYSAHGSQAQNILTNMQRGAVAMAEGQEAALGGMNSSSVDLYGEAAAIGQDQVNELMMDWDAMVGSVTREMAASQQAALNRIESQGAATQNYMDMLAAALPSLEARLQAQIEMARQASLNRGGGGGGGGGSNTSTGSLIPGSSQNPYLQALQAAHGDAYLGSVAATADWASKQDEILESGDPNTFTEDGVLSEAERKAISELWGIDEDAWGEGTTDLTLYQSSIREGKEVGFSEIDTLKLHGGRLSELYGVEAESVQAAYYDGMGLVQDEDGNWIPMGGAGEDMVVMFDALISAGMDTDTAYETIWDNRAYFLADDPKYEYLNNTGEEDAANTYAAEMGTALKWNYAFTDLVNGYEPNWSAAFGDVAGENWFTSDQAHSFNLWPGVPAWDDRVDTAYKVYEASNENPVDKEDFEEGIFVLQILNTGNLSDKIVQSGVDTPSVVPSADAIARNADPSYLLPPPTDALGRPVEQNRDYLDELAKEPSLWHTYKEAWDEPTNYGPLARFGNVGEEMLRDFRGSFDPRVDDQTWGEWWNYNVAEPFPIVDDFVTSPVVQTAVQTPANFMADNWNALKGIDTSNVNSVKQKSIRDGDAWRDAGWGWAMDAPGKVWDFIKGPDPDSWSPPPPEEDIPDLMANQNRLIAQAEDPWGWYLQNRN